MTVKITRKDFCKAIEALEKTFNCINSLYKLGINVFNSSLMNTIDVLCKILSNLMNDDKKFSLIDDFCLAYDFGKKKALTVIITDDNDSKTTLVATTANELYDMLLRINGDSELTDYSE